MKKTLLLVLALLPSLLLHSQEANDGNFTELTIIGRLEGNAFKVPDNNQYDFSFGESSIHSLFEGQHNNLSWTISTHIIHAGGDYGWPYTSLGYSNTVNFIDFFLANYSVGDFTFSLGKDVIKTGGMEFEEWDWEINPLLASPLWNELASYQWGASVSYDFLDNQSFAFQAVTSPFGEHPFKSGLYTYSLQWRADFSWLNFVWSVTALEKAKGEFDYLFSLGQNFQITENLGLSLDWNNNYGVGIFGLLPGNTINTKLYYDFNEKFSCSANFVYVSPKDSIFDNLCYTGLTLEYYPIEDLKIYANTSVDIKEVCTNFILGARYYLRLIK